MTDEIRAPGDVTMAEEDLNDEISFDHLVRSVRALARGEVSLAMLTGVQPDDLYRLADFGYDRMEAGCLDDARVIFKELVAWSPYDAYFHAMLGSIAQRQHDYYSAGGHYRRAAELDPEDAFVQVNLGEVLLHLCRLALNESDISAARQTLAEAEMSLSRAIRATSPETGRAQTRAGTLKPAADRLRRLLTAKS